MVCIFCWDTSFRRAPSRGKASIVSGPMSHEPVRPKASCAKGKAKWVSSLLAFQMMEMSGKSQTQLVPDYTYTHTHIYIYISIICSFYILLSCGWETLSSSLAPHVPKKYAPNYSSSSSGQFTLQVRSGKDGRGGAFSHAMSCHWG